MARWKLVASALLAAVGVALGGLALLRALSRTEPDIVVRPATAAAAALKPALLDTFPDECGAESAIIAAASAAEAALNEHHRLTLLLPADRRADLIAAFRERLAATIDAQYERDVAARAARGMPAPASPPSEAVLAEWKRGADWYRGAALGMAHLEVRLIFQEGRRIAAEPDEEGYDALVYSVAGPKAFPIPSDAAGARLDVVEVRLPMKLRPVRGNGDRPALVGYQFAWSRLRSQWIPFRNVVYSGGDATYAAVQF